VAAYISVGDEPTTGPLLDALVDGGTSVVVPVVVGDRLDWAEYAGAASLRPGPFGLLQPTGPRLGAAALSSAAIVVVPALAVDAHGRRLGRGGGYYDRALVGVTASVVALVYDDELVDEVPVEPHDRRVDAVLRPSGLLRLPFHP
jgi:5-formyltetrahydrofolate cyclo-ligase